MKYTLEALDKRSLEAVLDSIDAAGELFGVDVTYVTEAKRFAKKVYTAYCAEPENNQHNWLRQYQTPQRFEAAYRNAIAKTFEKFMGSVSTRQLKKALMGITRHYQEEIPDFIAILPIIEEPLERESVYCTDHGCTQLNVLLPDGSKIPLIGTKNYARR